MTRSGSRWLLCFLLKWRCRLWRKDEGYRGLQQPRVIAGAGPDGVVICIKRKFYRLFTQPKGLTQAASDRDGPFFAGRNPVRSDIRRRARRPSITKIKTNDWIEQELVGSVATAGGPPKDQILLATMPKTSGPASLNRNATDGPEPHTAMSIKPFTSEKDLTTFARSFFRDRVGSFRKDLRICLTADAKRSHAYFPGLITCIGFLDLLRGL
jgi:hypothetical protein